MRSPRSPRGGLRRAGVAAALVASLALAGCGGIPTDGSVRAGDLVNDDLELDIGFAPQGPRAGAEQEEIMQDFLLAATNPQGNYAVARQFLAKGFENDWKPDEIVLIRSGTGAASRASETSYNYSVNSSASVDADGRYEQGDTVSATLNFEFVQENGEWRISSAPPGIVLSEDSFDRVFRSHPLYYFDPTYQYLVPDLRWFPNTSGVYTHIVGALLAGQASWLQQGVLISEFPPGTRLGDGLVSIASGVATVDLSEEARSTSPIEKERMRQQLFASLATVSSVVITVGGSPLSGSGAGIGTAMTNPTVEPLPLVGRDTEFGFATSDELTPLATLSKKVSGVGANAAALDRGKSAIAVRGNGGVWAVRTGDVAPLLVDDRPGLVAPSIDAAGFIWSVPSARASAIRVFELTGEAHEVTSAIAGDSQIVSLDVSRDGARVLLALSTPVGPRLVVAGIIRQNNVPVGLGELVELPIIQSALIDASWVDEGTVAALSKSDAGAVVTAYQIGGPRTTLGTVPGGTAIVGGNNGTDGLRVLRSDGVLLRPRGSSWQNTGITASFIATQQ